MRLLQCSVEAPNIGHIWSDINSVDLFFVERFSSLGSSKSIVGILLGPKVVSLIEIHYTVSLVGRSPIGGSFVIPIAHDIFTTRYVLPLLEIVKMKLLGQNTL